MKGDIKVAPATPTVHAEPTVGHLPEERLDPAETARLKKKYMRLMWLAAGAPVIFLFLIITLWGVIGFLGELGVVPQSLAEGINLLLPILVTLAVLAIPVGILGVFGLQRRRREVALTRYDTRSGKGDQSVIPEEINGWNWGAFVFGIIWGLRHNVWFSIVSLIPFVGFVYMFFAGINGSEWAWQRNKWRSVEEFKQSRKRWNIAALIALPIFIIFGILGALLEETEVGQQEYETIEPGSFIPASAQQSASELAQEAVLAFKQDTVFPQKVDEVTYLTDVEAVGNRIIFSNEVTEEVAAPIRLDAETKSNAKISMKEYQVESLCESEEIMVLFTAGVEFVYHYLDASGERLFEVFVDDSDCTATSTAGA